MFEPQFEVQRDFQKVQMTLLLPTFPKEESNVEWLSVFPVSPVSKEDLKKSHFLEGGTRDSHFMKSPSQSFPALRVGTDIAHVF